MIGYVTGEVRDGVVITASGVGYEVNTGTVLEDGTTVELWCVTVFGRDGAMSLYGFTDKESRQLFQALRKIQGIGSQTALGICQLGTGTVVTAIKNRDTKTLAAAKGVSVKTAERICAGINVTDLPDVDSADIDIDLVDTLVGLGYKRDQATDALAATSSTGRAAQLREAITLLAS